MLKGLPKYQIWGKINQITLTRLNKAKKKKATGLLRQADGRYDLPKSLRPHSPSSFNRKKKNNKKAVQGSINPCKVLQELRGWGAQLLAAARARRRAEPSAI